VVLEKLGEVRVKVGVINSDTPQSSAVESLKDLSKGQKLSSPLSLLENQERLIVKIGAARSLHQVFILLRNKGTEEEVGFITQRDGDGSNYKVDLVSLVLHLKL